MDPRANFSTGENSVYIFGPFQDTLGMRFEAFSTPAPTHLAMAALSLPQCRLDGKGGWVVWMGCRQGEGAEEGNDRDKLYPQRGVEGDEAEFWTAWRDARGTFCDKLCVQLGHFGGPSLDDAGLVTLI